MHEYKQPEEMTADEAANEFHHLDSHFCHCRDSQCGISTKEFVRFNLLSDRLVELGRGDDEFSLYHDHTASEHCIVWATSIAASKRLRTQKTN